MKNPVIMHANFGEMQYGSYGTNTVASICKMATEIGYDGIEFRSTPPKEFAELPFEDFVNQMADGKKEYGIQQIIMGVAVAACADPDKEIRDKCIEDVVGKIKYANDVLETTLFNTFMSFIESPIKTNVSVGYEFNGSAAATEEYWKFAVDTYQKIGQAIAPLGVKMAFETHFNYIHDLPEPTMRLLKLIDNPVFGVNIDYGNAIQFPEHPSVVDTIDAYKEKLLYIHLKNSISIQGEHQACALSEGEINHREYLKKLKTIGYEGPIAIESTRLGDRGWFAKQDFDYYKSVAEKI